ncbi:MAG: hypothetical protein JSS39_13610 [Nitrospira sp.]|nr:hypothetical protein [Nitrospira sp.]
MYVVSGDKPSPDLKKFFVAQGFSAEQLENAFNPDIDTHGLTNHDISIIPADKAFKLGEVGYSNTMNHEVGHALTDECDAKGGPHPCGGVMQTPVSPRENLEYDSKFRRAVTSKLTLVPEVKRYTAVWQPSTENEVQVYEWSYQDYRAKYDELWQQGWRLKLLSPYVIDNEVRYTAVWRPSIEAEIQIYDAPYEAYRTEYDKLWNQGWRLKLLSLYVINNEVRYTAVWRPITEPEIQLYGWSIDALRARYDELWQQGWRLKLLSPYVLNGIVWYTAVFKLTEEGEIQIYGWYYDDYRAEYDKLWYRVGG